MRCLLWLALVGACSKKEPDRYDWVLAHHDAGALSPTIEIGDPATRWQHLYGIFPPEEKNAWGRAGPRLRGGRGAEQSVPAREAVPGRAAARSAQGGDAAGEGQRPAAAADHLAHAGTADLREDAAAGRARSSGAPGAQRRLSLP